jgi:hypothetical protein
MPLEVLDFTLVLLGFFFAGEGSEVAAFAGRRVFLARVEAVFSGF